MLRHPRPLTLVLLLLAGCRRDPIDAGAETRRVSSPRDAPVPTLQGLAGAERRSLSGLADVAQRVMPSVVSVASTRPVAAMRPELQRGLGSGVVVAPGVILTNAHVVEGARELEITGQNEQVLPAELVGSDPKSDLAVLRIKGQSSLPPLEFGDSARLRPADVVLAIGNPFGVGQTVTMGIVSGKGRADLGVVDYEDFIQTDAAINPGNSGGALVDVEGKLVGVPTAILSRSGGAMGVGFAIPSNMVRPIMNSLLEHGRVIRGYLGVRIQEIEQPLAKALGLPNTDGVLVSDVDPGSPAAKAGLRRADVVLSVDRQLVRRAGELQNVVASTPVGKEVEVVVVRGQRRETLRVKVAEMPGAAAAKPSAAPSSHAGEAGLSIAPLDDVARRRLQLPASIKQGVAVSAVRAGSPADRAGLHPGDVILEMGRQPLGSPQQLSELWAKSKGTIALLVWRHGHTVYMAITR